MEILDTVPEPSRGQKVDWAEIERLARANPGKWVVCDAPVNPAVANHIKNGRYSSINPEGLELSTRRDKDDPSRSLIYVRAVK